MQGQSIDGLMCSRSWLTCIAEQDFELRRDINESEDYVLVHEAVWELLKSWYGGGPELKRSVIGVGIQVRTRRLDHDVHPAVICCKRTD